MPFSGMYRRTSRLVISCFNSTCFLAKKSNVNRIVSIRRKTGDRALSHYHGCIIGSGPSGIYLAQDLLRQCKSKNIRLHLDIIEKLAVPYGLVRYGVAPDHQDIKNVEESFESVLRHPNVSLLAGVDVGRDVTLADLQAEYNFVVLSYGQFYPKLLGIKGEDLKNIYTARDFVAWYNGFPTKQLLKPDLNGKRAVLVGMGNVALDVARLLLTQHDNLKNSHDIPENVLGALRKNKIKEVIIVARGGVEKVAFTIKEFREMTKLPNVSFQMDPNHFDGVDIEELPRNKKRLVSFMKQLSLSKVKDDCESEGANLNWTVELQKVPKSFVSDAEGNVSGIVLEDKKTGAIYKHECDLVVTCIGYTGKTIDPLIVFDSAKGCLPNEQGRVLTGVEGTVIPALYCNGWIKTGPKGNIATTLVDACRTSDVIMNDLTTAVFNESSVKDSQKNGIKQLLHQKGVKPLSYKEWVAIDQKEKSDGRVLNKVREKVVCETDMKRLLDEINSKQS